MNNCSNWLPLQIEFPRQFDDGIPLFYIWIIALPLKCVLILSTTIKSTI